MPQIGVTMFYVYSFYEQNMLADFLATCSIAFIQKIFSLLKDSVATTSDKMREKKEKWFENEMKKVYSIAYHHKILKWKYLSNFAVLITINMTMQFGETSNFSKPN